jgi:hypothetical protein
MRKQGRIRSLHTEEQTKGYFVRILDEQVFNGELDEIMADGCHGEGMACISIVGAALTI